MKPLSKWKVLVLVSSFVFVADQVTKYLAVEHLTWVFEDAKARTFPEKLRAFLSQKEVQERGLAKPGSVQVVPDYWQHRYTQNRGAAWGFLSGANERFRVPFFYLVSIGAVIFIFSYYRKLTTSQRYLQIALALVLGGAVGNAVDRLLRGYVIDFIDWHWRDLHWPTFNVADSAISVGLVMLVLEMVFVRRAASQPAEKKA